MRWFVVAIKRPRAVLCSLLTKVMSAAAPACPDFLKSEAIFSPLGGKGLALPGSEQRTLRRSLC